MSQCVSVRSVYWYKKKLLDLMSQTLHTLEHVMHEAQRTLNSVHEALPPGDPSYPFTIAQLAPVDQGRWHVSPGEYIHVMKIKDGHVEPGFQAPSSRDVVKSTLLMARNDLPIGSGCVSAFVVLKLMTLVGRGIGEREEEVFKEVFSAYLKRFRSPVKLMPKARTMIIHPTVGGTERFREGQWYGMGDRPRIRCEQLVRKEIMIYSEVVGVHVEVESTPHPTTGAVQRRLARIPVLRECNRGKIVKKGRAKDRQCDLLDNGRESHATAVATQIMTRATISGLYWPGENPLDVNDFDRRRFDRARPPFHVIFSG